MAVLPNEQILASIGLSPASDGQTSIRTLSRNNLTRTRSASASASTTLLSPIKAGTEMKSSDFRTVTATYKHGRIEREHEIRARSASPSASRTFNDRKPKIQVVIPDYQRNRPLPTSPFFGQAPLSLSPDKRDSPGNSRSAAAEVMDVSPPSGSGMSVMRASLISPLNVQQHSKKNIYTSISVHVQKSSTWGSSDDSQGSDNSSAHSRSSSSVTSVEANTPPIPQGEIVHQCAESSKAFSKNSPKAGVVDGEARLTRKSVIAETGPRSSPSPPSSRPRQYSAHPPLEEYVVFKPTCTIRPQRSAIATTPRRRPFVVRKPRGESSRRNSLTNDPNMSILDQAVMRSESRQESSHNLPSPTLSEAEDDLEQHLTSFTEDNPFQWDDLLARKDNTAAQSPSSAPEVPAKSSKRHSKFIDGTFRMSRVPGDHIASQLQRNRSLGKGKGLMINIPEKFKRISEDFFLSPLPLPHKSAKRIIPREHAENVILCILRNLESLDDLFATAKIDRGFYRVFKLYELELMKSALRKQSPPAWEHREICYPGHDQLIDEDLEIARPRQEYTPRTYWQYHTRDDYIIAALKLLIDDKCQAYLRPEIANALISTNPAVSARVDDALWRIWTFCKLFGCGKGREGDIVAQMDWLKGGVLVHQKTCTSGILTTDALDMNDTLANAPECFAKGNGDGLTAEQLFDMMELWSCLVVLIQPLAGRTILAREYGVYDNTNVRGGDVEGEETLLDEWCYYLLTLGLSPILNLAAPCRQSDPSAFLLAERSGWMNWNPPVYGGTRRHFLMEAASRVYEENIAITYSASSSKEVQRQLSKQRIQNHITELRQRSNTGDRLLNVRLSQQRPLSEWDNVMNGLTRPRPAINPASSSNLVSYIPTIRSAGLSGLSNELMTPIPELPATRTPPPRARSPPRRIVAQPLLPSPPPSTAPSVANRDSIASNMRSLEEHPAFRQWQEDIPEIPSLEDHPAFRQHLRNITAASGSESDYSDHSYSKAQPASQQHQFQHNIYNNNAAENSAQKAIHQIVEMGFTPEQARHALRMTDLGDGLRVDRAVNLLLRGG
jgi:hypothetical protein